MTTTIRPKDRDAVIQSLRAGVVPRSGQHLIQVGRTREIETLVSDIDRIADGGSGFRVVIGEYGAGKTFFLNLVRAVGLEKKLVVASADLNPDRRLHASGGQARSLYAELMRNLATRTKPEGGALPGIVEKFIATAKSEAKAAGLPTETVIRQKLEQLTELVNGYDFADVIAAYYRGYEEGNEQLKSDAVRWLRGEFSTKTKRGRTSPTIRAISRQSPDRAPSIPAPLPAALMSWHGKPPETTSTMPRHGRPSKLHTSLQIGKGSRLPSFCRCARICAA